MKNNIHFAAKTYMVKSLIPNYFLFWQSAHTTVMLIPGTSSSNHQYNQETYNHRNFIMEKTFKIIESNCKPNMDKSTDNPCP